MKLLNFSSTARANGFSLHFLREITGDWLMIRSICHAAPLTILALLAGCDRSDGSASANESAAASGNLTATAPATDLVERAYACKPALAITARYDNRDTADPEVLLTIDGRTYDLDLAQSGSGARYTSDDGRSEGMTLTWWNKGTEATLFENKKGAQPDVEKIIATCTEKS